MIGRSAFGRAPLLACPKSLAARASFGRNHRCLFHIDDVNIHLTGIAFAGSRIFTLSTFGRNTSARSSRPSVGGIPHRHRNQISRSRSPSPTPEPGPRQKAQSGSNGRDGLMIRPDLSTAPVSHLAVAPPAVAQYQSADWGLVRAEQVDIIRHEPFRRPTSNQLANGSAKQATLPACTQLRQPALRICAFTDCGIRMSAPVNASHLGDRVVRQIDRRMCLADGFLVWTQTRH